MSHAKTLLRRKDQSLKDVVAVLEGEYRDGTIWRTGDEWFLASWRESDRSVLISMSDNPEFRKNIGDDVNDDEDEEGVMGEAQEPVQKMILGQLILFLESVV